MKEFDEFENPICYSLDGFGILISSAVPGDDRSVYVQTDYDYPGIATSFGWSIALVQQPQLDDDEFMQQLGDCPHLRKDREPRKKYRDEYYDAVEDYKARDKYGRAPLYCALCLEDIDPALCDHSRTDGTVNCPDCGLKAADFISAAYAWLVDNEGIEAEDPGYLSEE